MIVCQVLTLSIVLLSAPSLAYLFSKPKLFNNLINLETVSSVVLKHNEIKLCAVVYSCLLLTQSPIQVQALQYDDGGPISELVSIRNSLGTIRREGIDSSKIFNQIEYLLKTTRLGNKFNYAMNVLPAEKRGCASPSANAVVDNLFSIIEYFSVSNDSASKMMISDSYPGEKLEFVRAGLEAVDRDFDKFLSCYDIHIPKETSDDR